MALAETVTDDFTAQGSWVPYGPTGPTWNHPGLLVPCNGSGCVDGHTKADMRASYYRVQVTAITGTLGNGTTGQQGAFFYTYDNSDGYRQMLTIDANGLHAGIRTNYVDSYLIGTTHAIAAGDFIGFSASADGSTFYWEHSPDGTTFTPFYSQANPWGFAPNPMGFAFYGEGGGSVTFANENILNLPTPPTNTSLPTVTGTVAVNSTITGHIGTWTGADSYAYRFAYDPNYGGTDGIGTNASVARTVPGTTGTTTNPATTKNYTLNRGDTSRNIYFEVTATNTDGDTIARSSSVIVHGSLPLFQMDGNPWITPLPLDAPVSSSLTTTLRSQLSSWSTSRHALSQPMWLPQGGDYGDAWSSYLHYVDNSMTRQPIVLIGIDSNDIATGLTNPKYPQVQNSENPKEHLAWCLAVRDGGVPIPPSGVFYVGGDDMHTSFYNVDSGTFIDTWVTLYVPNATSFVWGGTTVTPHNDYKGKIVTMFAGYIRNVHTNKGYYGGYYDAYSTGSWAVPYIIDEDGNREYSSWGAMATGIPYFGAPTILESEVLAGVIPHAIGVVTPGSNSTHNFPATRHDTGSGSSLPQGGIWRLDPTLNIASLPSLGSTAANNMRTMLFTAFQDYGAIVIDSTGHGCSFRFESVNGVWPNVPNTFNTSTIDFDALMESVPYTSWSMIDPTYRPAPPVGPITWAL